MEVLAQNNGATLVISLVGELDEHWAQSVSSKMDKALQQNHYDNIVLDLSKMSFMDSTGIGVLIGRYKIARKYNKKIYVQNPTSTVDKILKMSGLYEILNKI